VRELRNVIERAMLFEEREQLGTRFLQPGNQTNAVVTTRDSDHPVESNHLVDAEKQLIRQALQETDGNVCQAARRLGMSREMLRYRIRKYGLRT